MEDKTRKNIIMYITLVIGTGAFLFNFYLNLPIVTRIDWVYFISLGLVGGGMVYLAAAELFTFSPKFFADAEGLKFPDKTVIKWENIRGVRFEQHKSPQGRKKHFLIVSLRSGQPDHAWNLSEQRFNPIEVMMEVEAVLPVGMPLEKVEVNE
ncbi:MAG: hypothetical protein FD123_4024 [Bacteroidetes bacterium]|nr:MAG: hypothetical protein FD123_4024 [Bacteroidota bacterium]